MEANETINKRIMWEVLLDVVASNINNTTNTMSTDANQNNTDNVTSNEGNKITNNTDLQTGGDNNSYQSQKKMEIEYCDTDQETQGKSFAVQSISSSHLQTTDTLPAQDNKKHTEMITLLDQHDKQDIIMVNESQKPPESRNAINEIYHTNHNIKTIKIVYNVSPMYVLEKALNYFRYKNTKLSFELVGISVNEPGEKFIYRCRANTFSAVGEGQSKKDAMENATLKLYEKYYKEINPVNNIILNITSVNGNTDIEVYQYYKTDISTKQISRLINIAESAMGKQLKYYYIRVYVNPIAPAHLLNTNISYKWTLLNYNYQLLFTLDEHQKHIQELLTKTYNNVCQIFNFQTTGPEINETNVKDFAIDQIFEQMYDIGMDKLNKLKSLQLNFSLLDMELQYSQYNISEKNCKLSSEWNIAQILRTYIIIMNITGQYEITDYLGKFILEKLRNQTEMELEKYIKQYKPGSSALKQLKSMCQKLGIYTFYSSISDLQYQQQNKFNLPDKLNYDHSVLLEINTLPVIVTIGRASTIALALENAAKYALHILNAFWYLK